LYTIQQAILDADSPADLQRLYKKDIPASAKTPEVVAVTGNL